MKHLIFKEFLPTDIARIRYFGRLGALQWNAQHVPTLREVNQNPAGCSQTPLIASRRAGKTSCPAGVHEQLIRNFRPTSPAVLLEPDDILWNRFAIPRNA